MRRQIRNFRDTVRIVPWLLLARFGAPSQNDPPDDLDGKTILIIQWNAIGDALMTTPLLSRLSRRFPSSRIDVLATDVNRPIFDCQTGIGAVYTLRPGKPKRNLSLWNELKRNRYDVVIDASAAARSACLTRSLNGGSSIGFSRTLAGGLFRIDLASFYCSTRSYSDHRHIPSLIESLADSWDTSPAGKLSFIVPDAGRSWAESWFERNDIEADRSVILHPGAKWEPKRWPESHWTELARSLLDHWTPILVGSKDDADMIRRISAPVGPGIETLVGLDISKLGGVVQKARGAICGDSFVMHLASALGKPVVALFGPVEPQRVVSKDDLIEVLYRGEFCSPCDLYFSANRCWRGMNFCLQHISPEEVLRAFGRWTQRRGEP
jgi:heptosyltransferase-2